MKKRLFATLLCLVLAVTLCGFSVNVSAEEADTQIVEEDKTETVAAEEYTVEIPSLNSETSEYEEPQAVMSEENTYHTLFTRIWEFVKQHSGETFSIIGSATLLILNLIIKRMNSKNSKDTRKALDDIKEDVKETCGNQYSVVNVVNSMIDGYNGLSERYDAMKISYDQYGAMDGERNRVVGAVLATNVAILEILTTVYVNNKNLPQGVKDLVNIKYANCLKTLEDDTRLRAVVEAVRNNIGNDTGGEEANAEDTEA